MASPDRSRNHTKRDLDTRSDGKNDRARDDEERKAGDKRRHRSSKSRKISNQEDSERLEGSERKRKSGDRNENRRRSGGSTRGDSDEDDIDAKKELRSKQTKKSKEESSLEKLSSWYRDGELENKQDGVDKLGTRSHGRGDESERRKMSSKFSDHESSQRRSKNKEARLCNGEHDKSADRDSKFSERRESNVEKGHNLSEQARHHKRRWDEPENRKTEDDPRERSELRSGKPSDAKRDSAREKSMSVSERTRGLHSNDHKVVKSSNKEGRKVDSERHKSRGRSEPPEEGYKTSPRTREDRSGKENSDRHRRQRTPIKRDVETRERFLHTEADASMIAKERSGKGVRKSSRSRTPERSGRRCLDSEAPEMNYEKSINAKRKEPEKDAYRDDRSVGRDDSLGDRNRDREGSKDFWKRRQSVSNNKEAKDGEIVYERGKEWEFQRLSRERNDHGRSGGRKDATRSEAVKTSSNFGISNENYDVIEIQTKPIDYGRPEQGSSFSRRRDVGMPSAPYDEERAHAREDRGRTEMHGSGLSCDDSKERYMDGNVQDERRRGQKDAISTRAMNSPLPSYGNLDQSPYNRVHPQGVKGAKVGKGVRARPAGRDSQQVGMPLPLMGSPFGPLGMPPPGPMQSLTTSMSPVPGPPISLNMFIPPFSPPVWPGSRGMDMNMLPIPPGLSPFPPGLPGLRFSPNMAAPPNPAMYFNQLGSGRGAPPNASGPGFNTSGPAGPHERSGGGWMPPRSGPHGKAPSRGEQNDYSQNFVDTGMRPQNFIRELELTNVVEDYPKLRELIQKKDEIVAKSASPPMYFKCDLKEFALSPEFFGTKFDVILIDPPWEEYVHRAPGVADHMDYWTPEEILNLKIEAIADTPSFIFLWVGDGMGLEQGRHCLKKWGYRRCEDICWVKTNKANAAPGLRHDSHTLFQHSKEHCLMGIKGTVRRSTDGHIIHANIDTDVLIAEEPPYGSTSKPEDMYRIVEHFALGRRRLELFGEDHNIRSGWLTVGKGLSSSNFNAEAYVRNFAGKDGKVWQGGGGRNPPPETPHLVLTTPDIESLRPKSPMKNQHQQQQQQHQSASISVMADKRSPPKQPNASSSTPPTPAPWIPPAAGFKGSGRNFIREGRGFEMHAYTTPYMHGNGEFLDVESHRTMPMNIF